MTLLTCAIPRIGTPGRRPAGAGSPVGDRASPSDTLGSHEDGGDTRAPGTGGGPLRRRAPGPGRGGGGGRREPGAGEDAGVGERHVPPHHRARDRGRRGAGGGHPGHRRPRAHHRDRVAHVDHLVELVRDEHHRAPLVAQRAQHAPEVAHLGRGEHGGGLVEHEDAGAAEQRLDDLDALRLAHREVGHPPVGVHDEPGLAAHPLDLAHRRRAVEEPARGGLAAEHHVLGDRERGDEHEVLVHHPHAGRDRLRGAPPGGVAAVHLHGAGVGGVHPREDAHQRRLPGAVLADERVDLPRAHLERGVAVGAHRAERLGDAVKADGEWCAVSHPTPRRLGCGLRVA